LLLENKDKFKYQISLKYSNRLLKIVFDCIGCVRLGRSIRVSKLWIFPEIIARWRSLPVGEAALKGLGLMLRPYKIFDRFYDSKLKTQNSQTTINFFSIQNSKLKTQNSRTTVNCQLP
jgi:hypothetical protein